MGDRRDWCKITIGEKILFYRAAGLFVEAQFSNLGLIFQTYALWPHMTVLGNLDTRHQTGTLSGDVTSPLREPGHRRWRGVQLPGRTISGGCRRGRPALAHRKRRSDRHALPKAAINVFESQGHDR
jgi:ABC-type sugar transport system ATPase subunit